GPWRAVQRWMGELSDLPAGLAGVTSLRVHLFGSLALTGRGHATDQAVALALLGHDPETIDVSAIPALVADLAARRTIRPGPATHSIAFDPATDIVFHPDERLPGHANGLTCVAGIGGNETETTYYSVGGGFVLRADELDQPAGGPNAQPTLPHPTQVPDDLRAHCAATERTIAEVVRDNETAWRSGPEIDRDLDRIWRVMSEGAYRGCHTDGSLPGGLGVHRRAAPLARRLMGGDGAESVDAWMAAIRATDHDFGEVLQWISAFAMAVNEENANLGRVVTAPTNGAAGVIPAVLLYHLCLADDPPADPTRAVRNFLLVAGEIGTLFKKGATISAAMGGCMAEVGVSSAMAAAALAEAKGGSVDQALMAAEIAMEHHLGMTCDPVGGLVQVPCIERNTMGAVKAINAAELAVASDPTFARVSLDEVIHTMRDTAESMSERFKETSQGGLAVNVSVRVPEC
ncbi:MAG: L-serine ammonia-lyase, partial [Microthrixaceae bacterium]|nr:L-serine ammonia-lyase [Microthrixaceae bacterium]